MLDHSTPSRNRTSAINLGAKRSSPAATISTNISVYTNATPPQESWKFQRQNTLWQEISLTMTTMWKTRMTRVQQKCRHHSLRLNPPSHLHQHLHPRLYSGLNPSHLFHLRSAHHHPPLGHLLRNVVAEQEVSVPSLRNVETVEVRCHLQQRLTSIKTRRKRTKCIDLGVFMS